MMNEGGGGDQRISQQVVRLPVHQLGPGTEGAPVERQYIPRLLDLVDPGLDLGGFVRVISTPAWSSPRVTAERWRSPSAISRSHARTAPWGRGRRNSEMTFVSRRYMVGHSSGRGARRRKPRRGGAGTSARGDSASNKSFSVGRADCSSRRH
jgi:hypothetical protein